MGTQTITTVFHLDDPRPIAFGKTKRARIHWWPAMSENADAAARNRMVLALIDAGEYVNARQPRHNGPHGKHGARLYIKLRAPKGRH